MNDKVQKRIEAVWLGKSDTLDLGGLGLTELPEEIYTLMKLKILSVANLMLMSNQQTIDLLREHPTDDSQDYLEFLEEAEKERQNDLLVPKQLQFIDAKISQLRSLEVLDLSYNQLEKIPDSIGTLPKLRRLILKENRLTHLLESLSFLSSLELLDISDNPIQFVPGLPRLEKYKVYSDHFRSQKNEALRAKDVDLGVWFYQKETQYGLIR